MSLTAIGNRQNVRVYETAFPSKAKDAALAAISGNSLLLHSIAGYNNNGSACDIGLGLRYSNKAWNFYQLGASATDATTAIQAGTSTTIFDTTNNHGFYVQCKDRFSLLYLQIAQAQSGSPVYEYTYWNGSAFTTLNTIAVPSYASTSDTYLVFAPPIDWVVGSGGAVTTLIQGSSGYVIRARATTASGQNVTANALKVSKFYAFRGSVSANQQLQITFDRPEMLESDESVAAYFSTANNSNIVDVSYQVGG